MEPLLSGMNSTPLGMNDVEVPAPAQAQYPVSDREWDQLKNVIIRMYEHDGKPLWEVQQMMQKSYHFKAR